MKEHISNFDEGKIKEAVRIKQSYIDGEISMEMAQAQMKAHIGSIKSSELAYIEQYFQEEVDDECIKEDLHRMMAIYDDVLEPDGDEKLFAGHPIQNYIDENNAIRKVLVEIEELLPKKYIKNQWAELLEKLNLYKVHFSRKQNQLYTALEHKGFTRPTTTMWLYDNAVRDAITDLTATILESEDLDEAKTKYQEFKEMIDDLMDKEETILYPTSLDMIEQAEFAEMVSGDKEIGYCLIEPIIDFDKHKNFIVEEKKLEAEPAVAGDLASELAAVLAKHNVNAWNADTKMEVKQGLMSLNQINLVFQHLPVDLSYVDENEIVAFYSDTKHRVFPRSKGVIGRDVKNCHPKNSVDVVEEIIEKFRSGEQDEAEFWINKPNLFIYIKYVAVRDDKGNFKGVLEMMQDCTRIRAFEGSRTLLNWDNESKAEKAEQSEEQPVSAEGKITSLTPETKVMDVLGQYPGLKEYMMSKTDKFKMMNSPMFKVVGKVATAEMVSERTGIPFERLQKEFKIYLDNLED